MKSVLAPVCAPVVILCCLVSSIATAATTTTTIDGHLGFRLDDVDGVADSLRFYIGNLHQDEPIDLEVTVDRDNATISFTGSGDGRFYELDTYLTGSGPILPDVVESSFEITYTGLTFDEDPVTGYELFAIGRGASEGVGTMTLTNQNLFGGTVTFAIEDKAFFPDSPQETHRTWQQLGVQPFNFFLGEIPGVWTLPTRYGLAGWVMADAPLTFGGVSYALKGDLHSTPEPATGLLLLLGAGLIVAKRRR